MLQVKDVIEGIDSFAPFSLSCEWDNSGLQIGSFEQEVDRVAVSLDLTDNAIEEAMERGCSCLVTHHPAIFEPLRSIRTETPLGRKILACLENRLSVISAHTNWDMSPRGCNWTLADLIGLEGRSSLDTENDKAQWIGTCGVFDVPEEGPSLPEKLLERWNLSWVRDYNVPKTVTGLAIVGGSGGDLWPMAKARGCELFITADIKYHQVMEAVENGLGVIVADHGEMERATIPVLGSLLSEALRIEVIHVDPRGFDAGNIHRNNY